MKELSLDIRIHKELTLGRYDFTSHQIDENTFSITLLNVYRTYSFLEVLDNCKSLLETKLGLNLVSTKSTMLDSGLTLDGIPGDSFVVSKYRYIKEIEFIYVKTN
jgi:hypothetical protein